MAVDSDATIIEAYQDELDALATAITAETWATAWKKLARAQVYSAKLINQTLSAGDTSLIRNLNDRLKSLQELLEINEQKAGEATDTGRRLIRTRTSHGT